MTERHQASSPAPTDTGFRFSIEFDSENRVLSASVNGRQLSGAALGDVPPPTQTADDSCCSSEAPAPLPAPPPPEAESCCASEPPAPAPAAELPVSSCSLDLAEARRISLCSTEIPSSRSISLRVLKKISVQTAIAASVVMLLQYAMYLTQFHDPDFVKRYGWWLFFLDISIIPLVTAMLYLRAFPYEKASHMMGMMIGMAIGTQVGAMIGAVLGATNGFFIGALAGILCGVSVAIYAAWCCGPMAVMHGLMGGTMGGTMGAMIIVMMMMDHVLIFMSIFTALNISLVLWFIYLYYRECCCTENLQPGKPINGLVLTAANIVSIGLISALMLYGPKGPGSWTGESMDMNAPSEGCVDEAGNPFEAKAWQKSCRNKGAAEMACGAMKKDGG